jgi:hypothetical protein
MNCNYNYGNQCYNYYDKVGVQSKTYQILASEQE